MKSFVSVAAFAVATGLAATSALAQITIPTVPIGNPGNAPDPSTGNLYGSVAYSYNIGTTEVTNAQYAAFLNAKAATDTYSLYTTGMDGPYVGITRSGSSGSYTYSTVSGRENHPVLAVSFWDACRFANWLHNGQGNGDTETGAYTLGGVLNPVNASVTRNAGWQWAVTSENEWYKAAYHQPASAGGDADNYWLYPTSSNSVPTAAQVNFSGVIGNTTAVGSYAANYYGTFDMAGNLREWNDTIIERPGDSFRGVRGGDFSGPEIFIRADYGDVMTDPVVTFTRFGFRVSQVLPASTGCTYDLIADGGSPDTAVVVGSVTIEYDAVAVAWSVTYETSGSWWITATHLDAQCDANRFPINRGGNPQVGRFGYRCHGYAQQVTYMVPGLRCDTVAFAAHAVVVDESDCYDTDGDGIVDTCREETAWAAEYNFPGRNWAMWVDSVCD